MAEESPKDAVRTAIWQLLQERQAGRFPIPLTGRIPNFVGAEEAARRLVELPAWKKAQTLKCNPDSPQIPVRRAALEEGKRIYMAVPRLRKEACFIELDPQRLGHHRLPRAATIRGAFALGRAVTPAEMAPIDLIVAGSVAVRTDGARLGKGGGYSDLEYAIARQAGLVSDLTPIVTTVHELQITTQRWPIQPYDIPVDWIVTPEREIHTETELPRPIGIYRELLSPEMEATVPILRRFRR